MLKTMWARDMDIVQLVDTFFVSAATSLLGIRLYLYLAGYPRVGGGGLHIAHMLWGGLLMVVAILVQVMFVTRLARWLGALCGGLGFGLFIDELGKFVTSDNNYFFRPTAALIYLLFVLLFFASRLVVRLRGFSDREVLANAIDILKEATIHNLDSREREKALRLLRRIPQDEFASSVRRLLEETKPARNTTPLARLRTTAEDWYRRMVGERWFGAALAALFTLNGLLVLGEVVAILVLNRNPWAANERDPFAGAFKPLASISFLGWVELGAAVIVALMAILGVVLLRLNRIGAYRLFEGSALVSILIVQPFAFYEAQFFATGTLLFALPLLAGVQYFLRRERSGHEPDIDVPRPSARARSKAASSPH